MTASSTRFVSLRWRLIVPIFAVILILTMISVYALSRGLASGSEMSRVNVLHAAVADVQTRVEDALPQFRSGDINGALTTLRGSTIADVAINSVGRWVGSTIPLPDDFYPYVLTDGVQTPTINGRVYYTEAFSLEEMTTIAVLIPESAPFAAEVTGQLITLTLVTVAAVAVIAVFLITNVVLERVNKVRRVAESLAAGDLDVRTGMTPGDEIGALGYAIDQYADKVRERHDGLRDSLRRQRREIAHLTGVLEALPDGVIVQDMSGSVTFMNDRAKSLLQTEQALTQAATANVTDTLGAPMAPGLRMLGEPRRIEAEGRTLSAQSVAVISLAEQRVGTVTLVRDVTEEAKRERARETLFNQLVTEVSDPLTEAAKADERTLPREIGRHAGTLQKLIVELREVNAEIDAEAVKAAQRPLPLDALIYAIANEWRPAAGAANIELRVEIEQPGLTVLGDERRLRWAIGNIVDNSVKYTPPGGIITLEVKGEDNGMARLRLRDNGAGIHPDELPHVFTRFYRGNPVAKSGRPLRVPGTGQGLTISKTIIEAHGGAITVRSVPGVGTAVYIALPLTEPDLTLADDDEGETIKL
ncbi:MAG: HAMP domain-containing protein [Anaerolineae bacterium]|nr:HAMP domain-containing protein [Anaerolineae bacterium]